MKEYSKEMLEKIDLYLSGKMNPVDKSGFEAQIASDLDLKEEISFQKDVVNTIQQKEINRIKSNLNSIEVTLTHKLLQTKMLITYAAAVVVGLGSYFVYDYYSNDDNPYQQAAVVKVTDEHTNYYESESSVNENISSETEQNSSVEGESESIMKDRRTEEGSKIYQANASSDDNTNSSEDYPITVDDKDSEQTFNKEGVEVTENPTKNNSLDASGSSVDVSIKTTKSKKVEYQFYDDKLYLYGNFKPSDPYVIYDIATNYGTEYYFKIASKYYKLEPNQVQRVALEPITNPELIKELNKK